MALQATTGQIGNRQKANGKKPPIKIAEKVSRELLEYKRLLEADGWNIELKDRGEAYGEMWSASKGKKYYGDHAYLTALLNQMKTSGVTPGAKSKSEEIDALPEAKKEIAENKPADIFNWSFNENQQFRVGQFAKEHEIGAIYVTENATIEIEFVEKERNVLTSRFVNKLGQLYTKRRPEWGANVPESFLLWKEYCEKFPQYVPKGETPEGESRPASETISLDSSGADFTIQNSLKIESLGWKFHASGQKIDIFEFPDGTDGNRLESEFLKVLNSLGWKNQTQLHAEMLVEVKSDPFAAFRHPAEADENLEPQTGEAGASGKSRAEIAGQVLIERYFDNAEIKDAKKQADPVEYLRRLATDSRRSSGSSLDGINFQYNTKTGGKVEVFVAPDAWNKTEPTLVMTLKSLAGKVVETFPKEENSAPQTRKVSKDFLQKIAATNSCGIISDKGTIKKPFDFEGKKYVAVSSASSVRTGYTDAEAYQVIPEAEFKGKTFLYGQKHPKNDQERDTFYHGMLVKQGKEKFVLAGPKIEFVLEKPEDSADEQKTIAEAAETLRHCAELQAKSWGIVEEPENNWSAAKLFAGEAEITVLRGFKSLAEAVEAALSVENTKQSKLSLEHPPAPELPPIDLELYKREIIGDGREIDPAKDFTPSAANASRIEHFTGALNKAGFLRTLQETIPNLPEKEKKKKSEEYQRRLSALGSFLVSANNYFGHSSAEYLRDRLAEANFFFDNEYRIFADSLPQLKKRNNRENSGWKIEQNSSLYFNAEKHFKDQAEPTHFKSVETLDRLLDLLDEAEVFMLQNEAEDLPKNVNENCRVELSDTEILDRNRQLTNAMNRLDAENKRFEAEKDKHKSNVKLIESDILKYRKACDTGVEWRNLECEQRFDAARGMVDIFRLDTGDKIKTREMSKDELQKRLF